MVAAFQRSDRAESSTSSSSSRSIVEYCQQCLTWSNGLERNRLEPDGYGHVACIVCGAIDETSSTRVNHKDEHAIMGSIMDDPGPVSGKHELEKYTCWEDHTFRISVENVLQTYLVSPMTCILGSPAPHLVNGTRVWFLRIRDAEQVFFERKHGIRNSEARRFAYQMALAVLLAVGESNLIALNNRIGTIKPKMRFEPVVRGSDKIPLPTESELVARANRLSATDSGYMDSLEYMRFTTRRYTTFLQHSMSPVDTCLIQMMQCLNWLRQLLTTPWTERVKLFKIQPEGGVKKRLWVARDWEWIEKRNWDWDEVLRIGYGLFEAQECVNLWSPRIAPGHAVALTIWSMYVFAGEAAPMIMNKLAVELGSLFESTGLMTVTARFGELSKFLVAWSTSVSDANVAIPHVKLPKAGTLGNGTHFYAAQQDRGIPMNDMAAAAGQAIAKHWREISRARQRMRNYMMQLSDEILVARRMFAKNGGKYQSAVSMRKEAARFHSQPPSRSSSTRQSTPSGIAASTHLSTSELFATQRPVWSSPSQPMSAASMLEDTPDHRRVTLETLLATVDDDSSNDGLEDESDDGHPPARSLGLNLSNVPDIRVLNGFTVGVDGFSRIEAGPQLPSAPPYGSIRDNHASSTNGTSPAPAVMERGQSMASTAASDSGRSVSESEALAVDGHFVPSIGRKRLLGAHAVTRLATQQGSLPPSSGHPSPASSTSSGLLPVTDSDISGPILWKPAKRPASETAHVGILAREREQYVAYRVTSARDRGLIVSEVVEARMNAWIAEEKEKGTIPSLITTDYLTSLGIHGVVHKLDLTDYVYRNIRRWHPVESLLRLGVKPIELPAHLIVFSLIHLDHILHHYDPDTKDYYGNAFSPVDLVINEEQLDRELEILFKDEPLQLKDLLLTETESEIRLKQYQAEGIFLPGEKPIVGRKSAKPKPAPEPSRVLMSEFDIEAMMAKAIEEDGDGDDEGVADRIQETMLDGMMRRPTNATAEDGVEDKEVDWTEVDLHDRILLSFEEQVEYVTGDVGGKRGKRKGKGKVDMGAEMKRRTVRRKAEVGSEVETGGKNRKVDSDMITSTIIAQRPRQSHISRIESTGLPPTIATVPLDDDHTGS